MGRDEDARYWRNEAYEALEAAEVLLDNHRYVESGFFCHLAAEKMLKALVAQRTHRTPPRIHALWRLAEIAGVEDDFTAEQVDTIADLSVFQVEGRYPTDGLRCWMPTRRQGSRNCTTEQRRLCHVWIPS